MQMKNRTTRLGFAALAAAILGEALCCAAAALLLRHLGTVLQRTVPGVPGAVSSVLGVLETAPLRWSPLPPFLLCFAGSMALMSLLQDPDLPRGKRILRGILAALLGLLILLAAFALTLWLTEVNRIRFGDVLKALYRLHRSGGLAFLL